MIFKIFIVGWAILLVAIILNILASRMGIDTWYPFFSNVEKIGVVKAFAKTSFISKLFLFIIYPSLLGLVAFIIFRKIS